MRFVCLVLLCCVIATTCGFAASKEAGMNLYVATTGKDTNPGTKSKPFATLTRARDAIRELTKAGSVPAGGVTVLVGDGIHELAEPVQLTAEDSGTAACPIEYRALKSGAARLVGGRVVSAWQRVSDPAVLARLAPAAKGKAFQADLKALGLTDMQGINGAGTYRSDPGLELVFQDQPMTLARYPNEGYMHIQSALDAEGKERPRSAIVNTPGAKFICDDSRPAAWADEPEVWLHGFWVYDWADSRIPLGQVDPATNTVTLGKGNTAYGIRTGQWFYAENVLRELDSPGEWYLDRASGVLYFWPPAPLSKGQAMVSVVRDMVQLDDVSNVTFRGFLVEAGRGDAFVIKGGSNVRVVGCTIRNMGNWAVRVNGGTQHGVVGCDIYGMGQGGIYLDGGDRKTLVAAGHYADNNHIHHTSRWDPVYQQAIALRGVGNSATHNLIDNVPHIAIGFADNDMTIEYNEIHSSVYQSNDAGAIYTSPPNETWSMRGHKIRYNYLHNIHGFLSKGCMGVYLDDCFSSADISRNIFYDVHRAILIGGGRDNLITNNMFINCALAFSIDARGLGWAKGVGVSATQELIDLNYKQPPWSLRYPELLNILEDEPLAPKGNVVARNICWGGPWGSIESKVRELVKVEDNLIDADPLFVTPPPSNFALKRESPARALGFRAIPLDRIGVYESLDRASWPVTSTLRQDAAPPPPQPRPARKAGAAPLFSVPRLAGAVTIDGTLKPEEWFGLDPAKGLVLQEGFAGEKVAAPSKAWLAWDDEALYIAFDNTVPKNTPMVREDTWGGSDAIEVALSNPALGAKAPIIVLRGYTTGKLESSEESGIKAAAAKKAGENVQYRATVIDNGRWVAEMRVPFASLGINPSNADTRFPFNLSVRKQGDDPWVEWRSTGNCTWEVPQAGLIRFVR